MTLPPSMAEFDFAHRRDPWSVYWVHFQGVSTRVFSDYLGYREGRPVVRAGAPWLSAVIRRLESCPELLDRVPVP